MSKLRQAIKRLRLRLKHSGTNERTILSGRQLKPKNSLPSVAFFTTHKAASFYVNELLWSLLKTLRYQHVDLERYSFHCTENELNICDEFFHPNGLFYGALRQPVEIAARKNFKTILQLRDPRDAITSAYYSMVYSHSAPGHQDRLREFEVHRAELLQRGIDAYARQTPSLGTMNSYAHDFFHRDDVLVVHYEDMVNDFPGWLDRIVAYLELSPSRKTVRIVDRLKQASNFEVDREDIYSHKRQVTPGDHLRKLQPETIRIVNREFDSYFKTMAATGNLPATYQLPDTAWKPNQAAA